jgi:hypothetical protein
MTHGGMATTTRRVRAAARGAPPALAASLALAAFPALAALEGWAAFPVSTRPAGPAGPGARGPGQGAGARWRLWVAAAAKGEAQGGAEDVDREGSDGSWAGMDAGLAAALPITFLQPCSVDSHPGICAVSHPGFCQRGTVGLAERRGRPQGSPAGHRSAARHAVQCSAARRCAGNTPRPTGPRRPRVGGRALQAAPRPHQDRGRST